VIRRACRDARDRAPRPPAAGAVMVVFLAIGAPALSSLLALPADTAGGEGTARPAPAGSAPAAVLAGAAARPITPDLGPTAAPVNLAGAAEGRIATGVRDELSARALVLEAGGGAVAIVILDLYGLARDDVERIRASIRSRAPAIPLAGILVACTRTHSAPDATGQFTPPGVGVDSVWLEQVVRAAGDAVEEAWRARQPARLSFAVTHLPRLLSDARQPQRYDDQAALVRIERSEGKIGIATLAFFTGSPETLGRRGRLVSADYPGEARRAIEDAFGGPALIMVGASGGLMVPVAPAGGAPEEAPVAVGRALARGLLVAWSGRAESRQGPPADVTSGAIAFRAAPALVPIDNPALRESYATGHRRGRLDDAGRLASEVALLTLSSAGGPVMEIACLPGAIYPELVNGGIQEPQDTAADRPGEPQETPVKSMMHAGIRLVAGACGDDLGDIIPASEWDEKPPFAYGLKAAQRGEESSPGPRTAGILLRALADLMR
jgi:hypothetical protein